MRHKIVNLAPKETKLSPRELAVTFSDQERSYASDATVYRYLKARDLITSPEVAAAELSIENERIKVAKARETAASEAAAVKQAPNIKINSANLIRVVSQSRYCDAASFLRYNCHRTPKSGDAPNDTTLDADVCGLPGSADMPLLLEVNYCCGTAQKNDTFPYRIKAYLVCE
ncbi:MAG: hypothetical protein V7695_08090 [Sulfitobacter sp.]